MLSEKYISEEERLIKGINLRDEHAFKAVFASCYADLTFFANKYVNDLTAAEEIVSDAFAFLWEKRETISFTVSVRAYLFRMVQNRSLNYLKRRRIENEYVEYLIRNNLLEQAAEPESSLLLEKELERQVEQAVESLPPRCREVFKLSRFEYLKNKEIAQRLNLSPKTVERQMTIALEKLRYLLRHLLTFLPFIVRFFI